MTSSYPADNNNCGPTENANICRPEPTADAASDADATEPLLQTTNETASTLPATPAVRSPPNDNENPASNSRQKEAGLGIDDSDVNDGRPPTDPASIDGTSNGNDVSRQKLGKNNNCDPVPDPDRETDL